MIIVIVIVGLNTFSLANVVSVDPSFMDQEEEEPEDGHVHDEHCGHLVIVCVEVSKLDS